VVALIVHVPAEVLMFDVDPDRKSDPSEETVVVVVVVFVAINFSKMNW
jgi:uncharacterized membrane protein